MSYSILQLTDGTTTQSLISNGVALAREGNPLVLPELDESEIGGMGPYRPIQQEFTLDLNGANGPALTAIIETLQRLLHQARRWAMRRPGATAVRLQAALTGSSVGMVEGVVLGGNVILPATFPDLLQVGEVNELRLRLTHMPFLAAAESPVASSSVTNGDLFTVTLAPHGIQSPIAIQSGPRTLGGPGDEPASIFCFVASSNDIAILNANVFGTVINWFSMVDASANFARGTTVLRFTPFIPGTWNSTALGYAGIPSILKSGPKVVDVLGVVRSSSASAVWQVYFDLQLSGATAIQTPTRAISLTADVANEPEAIYLGTMSIPEGGLPLQLRLYCVGDTASQTLDFDYLVFVERKPTTAVLALDDAYLPFDIFGANTIEYFFDSAQLTRPDSFIGIRRTTATSTRIAISARGAPFLTQQGSALVGVWMAPHLTLFRRLTGGVLRTHTVTVTRRRAYLVVP